MSSVRLFIQEVLLEKRIREADITGGKKVSWGSHDHVKDLERRISDLSSWRDKQPKGSESRANYARLINRLKNELSSARRTSEKSKKSNKRSKQKAKKITPLENARFNLADAKVRMRFDPEEREAVEHWEQVVAELEAQKN